jgi:hypothetical protein
MPNGSHGMGLALRRRMDVASKHCVAPVLAVTRAFDDTEVSSMFAARYSSHDELEFADTELVLDTLRVSVLPPSRALTDSEPLHHSGGRS